MTAYAIGNHIECPDIGVIRNYDSLTGAGTDCNDHGITTGKPPEE